MYAIRFSLGIKLGMLLEFSLGMLSDLALASHRQTALTDVIAIIRPRPLMRPYVPLSSNPFLSGCAYLWYLCPIKHPGDLWGRPSWHH